MDAARRTTRPGVTASSPRPRVASARPGSSPSDGSPPRRRRDRAADRRYNDVETLKLLLDFGATHWLPDVYHDCAQHYAMINRSAECLEILAEKRKIWYRAAFGCEEPEKDESMYVPPIELPCYFELRGTQGGPVFGNDMVYEDGRKAGDDGPAPSGPGSIGT